MKLECNTTKLDIFPDGREVMHRATEELEKSGPKDKAPKVGDRAPDFSLRDAEGALISLISPLEHGPVVTDQFWIDRIDPLTCYYHSCPDPY